MSIRIHELAKKIGMDNKSLLSLLKERNFAVKSVSSTIDTISAEALEQEFMHTAAEPAQESRSPEEPVPTSAPVVKIPAGVFVKSAHDVEVEKAHKAEKETHAPAPAPVVEPAKPAPAPALPVSRPPAPPPLPPMAKTPPPLVMPQRSAPPPVSVPPPVSAPSSVMASPGIKPAPVPVLPRPVSAPAPLPPVPAPTPAATPVSRPAPLPPPPVSRPPMPPATPKQPGVQAPSVPAIPTATVAPAPATAPGDVKILQCKPPIVVRDFATSLGLKPFKLISELMEMGIFASMTQSLEEAVALKVAEKHGFLLEVKHRGEAAPQPTPKEKAAETKKKADEEETKNLETRPPVVCILGHVDHGKTSLLDAIRKAHVAAGEAGGITQHIGAYQVEYNNKKITFLDTPGHAAFNKMRARGASSTDIAILVVAADDGFMPQTDEALKYIQNAGVTLMVAVNKMDVKGANLDQVKAQMQQRNIAPEDWGGEVVTVPVSAIKGTGVSDLLEMILLQADVMELKSNPKAEASGIIIESQMEVGRGPLATVIVQRGTLRAGDALVCGAHWCKVRAMFDDQGRTIKEAPPSTPVRVIGWASAPESGATFKAVKNAREAENLAEEEEQRLRSEVAVAAAVPKDISVATLFAEIAATQQKTLKVLVKTDVFGSAEAVRHVLDSIKSAKVQLEIVSVDVGLVTKNDVLMASTGGALIVGFNTKLENGVTPLAKHHGVRIETFSIIYELGDRVRDMMADLLDPDLKEVKLGAAEVRATFPLAKGFVAGCLVTEGKVTRNATARLRRGKEIVYEGKVGTLKRFKDDANEVRAGLECGIKLDDFNGYTVGDVIECYEIQKVRASL
jgi:translation initiation factor IF-2